MVRYSFAEPSFVLTIACWCRWAYVTKHKVQLPDEYDRIHDDLEPLWGVDPTVLRSLQAAREQEKACIPCPQSRSAH